MASIKLRNEQYIRKQIIYKTESKYSNYKTVKNGISFTGQMDIDIQLQSKKEK